MWTGSICDVGAMRTGYTEPAGLRPSSEQLGEAAQHARRAGRVTRSARKPAPQEMGLNKTSLGERTGQAEHSARACSLPAAPVCRAERGCDANPWQRKHGNGARCISPARSLRGARGIEQLATPRRPRRGHSGCPAGGR